MMKLLTIVPHNKFTIIIMMYFCPWAGKTLLSMSCATLFSYIQVCINSFTPIGFRFSGPWGHLTQCLKLHRVFLVAENITRPSQEAFLVAN